jgi:type I restriction enzyme S subunit
LDKINEVIADNRKMLNKLNELQQSIFYEMFGDPISNPKGWETVNMVDVAKVKIGPFGSLLHKEDYIAKGVPLVNPIHMKNGFIHANENFSISVEKYNELTSYVLNTNDIVWSRRGDIGRCALVTSKENGFICGTGSLFCRFNIDINPQFSIWLCMSPSISSYLIKQAKGATMLNINCGIVENLPIILPPLPLQEEFAAKIEAIETQKANIEETIRKMQTLLDSRMDYWFN